MPLSLALYMIGCIMSCIEGPSHEFFVRWYVVRNRFMNLNNLLENVVHYLLIGWINSLSHRYGLPMVSVVHYLLIGGMTSLSHQYGLPMVSALDKYFLVSSETTKMNKYFLENLWTSTFKSVLIASPLVSKSSS